LKIKKLSLGFVATGVIAALVLGGFLLVRRSKDGNRESTAFPAIKHRRSVADQEQSSVEFLRGRGNLGGEELARDCRAPPASLNCREIPRLFIPKSAKHAHFSRYLLDKPDWRERTVPDGVASTCRLFSGGHMRSPVSMARV
jgi:hypothetical protein